MIGDYDREKVFIDKRKQYESFHLLEGSFLVCPESWYVPMLRYSYHRMYCPYGGDATCIIENQTIKLEPGYLYLFPSKSVPYQIDHDKTNPFQVLWCHFDLMPDLINGLISIKLKDYPIIESCVSLWKKLAELKSPFNETYSVITLILYLMDRIINLQYTDFKLEGIERFISENSDTDLDVSLLAKHFGYSRSHFTRLFIASYSISPGEYLKMIRMSKASNMLINGCDVEKTAVSCGYSDTKSFYRAFKNYYQDSPLSYIKKHKVQLP